MYYSTECTVNDLPGYLLRGGALLIGSLSTCLPSPSNAAEKESSIGQ